MPPSRCRARSALLLLVTFTLTGPVSAGAPYDPCAVAPREFCISNRECCPPTVCVRVPASKYGYCSTNETRCDPPCGPGQWCPPGQPAKRPSRTGKLQLLTHGLVDNGFNCKDKKLPMECYENLHCHPGSVCRKTSRGNCCYPTKCPMKCRRGERCQKILRRCARPPADASPCYCPPLLRCVSACNPPCRKGQRCELLPSTSTLTSKKKYVCVTDKCQKNSDCKAGSICRKHRRGNCCTPNTCAPRCGPGQRCEAVLSSCPHMVNWEPPPCYCPMGFRCVNKVLKCDPPCGQGLRCGLSSGAPEPNGSRKHVCVRDKCSRTRRCPPGFRCQTDARGNCCRQYTCSRKCADNEVCRQVPPTAGQCPRPVLYPPPCFCQWRYACQSRCQPPCGPNERCAPAGGLEGRDRYTCQKKPVDECRTDRDCAAGSSCRRDSRGNCCYPTGCPSKCPVGERCQVQFPPCPPPPEPAPPCYCKPFYSCTSCTGPMCPIG